MALSLLLCPPAGFTQQTSPQDENGLALDLEKTPGSSNKSTAGDKENDIYAVPHKTRAQKKQWDGSGPARLPAPQAEKAAENALAAALEEPSPLPGVDDDQSSSNGSDVEDAGKIGSPLMESTPLKSMDRSLSASSTGPGLPPRTNDSRELEEVDGNISVPVLDTIRETGSSPDNSATDNPPAGDQKMLTPTKPAQVTRPKSATVARTGATLDLSRSNSDPPTPSKPVYDKNGKPINTNYPRLTRQGMFDSPNDSPHASPSASPHPSPLVLRKPFNFAAKPPSSPTIARAHSLPKTQPNESAEASSAVKKSASLGQGKVTSLCFSYLQSFSVRLFKNKNFALSLHAVVALLFPFRVSTVYPCRDIYGSRDLSLEVVAT